MKRTLENSENQNVPSHVSVIPDREVVFTHVTKPNRIEAFKYEGDIKDAIHRLGFVNSIGIDMNFSTPSTLGHPSGKKVNISVGDYVLITEGEVSSLDEETFNSKYDKL